MLATTVYFSERCVALAVIVRQVNDIIVVLICKITNFRIQFNADFRSLVLSGCAGCRVNEPFESGSIHHYLSPYCWTYPAMAWLWKWSKC